MPYDQAQARAILLNIKRKKGAKAAEAFAHKHKQDLKGSSKKSYTSRKARKG